VELFDRSTVGSADFDSWQFDRKLVLMVVARHLGLTTLSRPTSINSFRHVIRNYLHAAFVCTHLRRMFTNRPSATGSQNMNCSSLRPEPSEEQFVCG
jgi:hypothetical protein